ncbi:hypothetical protein BRD17_00445 [Halobacteriales archaeon SW_7_68_16]|nr:MAG: hypothetical protein BRD17_00445 [Halobacteriales archaeon SW_7_68_16]
MHDDRSSVPATVTGLRAEYASALGHVVADVGPTAASDRTGLDAATLDALVDGDDGALDDLSLDEVAAIQALADGAPDAETVAEIACDHLLLGMSMAVLDVDTVASEIEPDLTPKEVQQKLERRADTSFPEFLAMQHLIVSRRR